MKNILHLVCFLAFITACAPTVYYRDYTTQAEFDRDKAECTMYARGMGMAAANSINQPAYSWGSAAGTGAAQGMAAGFEKQAAFKECMDLKGYRTSR